MARCMEMVYLLVGGIFAANDGVTAISNGIRTKNNAAFSLLSRSWSLMIEWMVPCCTLLMGSMTHTTVLIESIHVISHEISR